MLKKLVLLSAVSMLGGAALAADLPARRAAPAPMFAAVPAFTWTGLYMGISGGGFFGDEGEITTTGVLAGNIAAVAANARPQRVSIDNEGFLIGGTLGYNMQFGSFVFGVEGDISYTDNESETTAFNPTAFGGGPAGSISSTFRTEMDYFATVRGRAGFAFGNVLVYGTGGLAIADVNMTADFNAPNFGSRQFLGERSETLTGYTVGGGVEFALPTNILPFLGSAVTLKAEYLYYDLGEETINVPAVGAGGVGAYNSRFENEGHIVRGGINVKFGTF